ncbi:signal peptidase II [Gephyromycinifex aptenodytis]|uniref:signal peptidase II n=1 Tax=Gephyromycinifex aptenodytis TaxID=2716227 RepID=UPI001D0272B6|nr:signal peptidase II [Gephyromycinifex aptenodytis]
MWAGDQATKRWALASLTPGQIRPFLGEVLQFTLVFNPGAAFSLGTGITPVFTFAMAAVAVAILVSLRRLNSRWWALALGLLLGGALGNLTDRLLRPPGFAHGHVVDFLMLPHWPVFNVADSAIVTAAALIALAAFRGIDFDANPKSSTGADEPSTGPDVEVNRRG